MRNDKLAEKIEGLGEKIGLGSRFKLIPGQGAYLVSPENNTGIWTVISERYYHHGGEDRVILMAPNGYIEEVGIPELLGVWDDPHHYFRNGKYVNLAPLYVDRPRAIWSHVPGRVIPEKVIKQVAGGDISEWKLIPYTEIQSRRKELRLKSKGWKLEPARHALSAKGIKTKGLMK